MAEAKRGHLRIQITDKDSGSIFSQSVESHLLFMILEKLEEIRINQIDIETELQNLKTENEKV